VRNPMNHWSFQDPDDILPEAEKNACQSCGKPTETLSRAEWDPRLLVWFCCEVYEDFRCPSCGCPDLEALDHKDYGPLFICQNCAVASTGTECEVRIGPPRQGELFKGSWPCRS